MRKNALFAFTIVALTAISLAGASGCQSKSVRPLKESDVKRTSKGADAETATDMWAASKLSPELTKKVTAEVTEGFKKAVQDWLKADSESDFPSAMTGTALEELQEQFKSELAQGKIKLRVHQQEKFEISKLKETEAALSYKYVDAGYYIDAKTKKQISQPINAKREWLVLIVKTANGWRISNINPLKPMQPESEQ